MYQIYRYKCALCNKNIKVLTSERRDVTFILEDHPEIRELIDKYCKDYNILIKKAGLVRICRDCQLKYNLDHSIPKQVRADFKILEIIESSRP